MIISLDMYQTLFAAVCVLMLGRFLKARIGFLEKFCIPAPVIGGIERIMMNCGSIYKGLYNDPEETDAVCRFHLSLLCDRHCRV